MNTNYKATELTNADGIANFVIKEGRYQVTVQKLKHGTHRGIVLVESNTNVTVFIPRQVVSYTWVVVPTGTVTLYIFNENLTILSLEIEDKYIFVLEATFETRVPIPGKLYF
jgi:hypothetical protein